MKPAPRPALGFVPRRIATLASRMTALLFAALAASGRIAAPTQAKEYR